MTGTGRTHPSHAARVLVALVTAVGVSAGLTGCGSDSNSGRSIAAACTVWKNEGIPLGLQLRRENDGQIQSLDQAFARLLRVGTGPGRVATVLDKMATKVPEENEPAFTQTAESLRKAVAAGGDVAHPLGAIGEALGNALNGAGAYTEVDRFISTNCAPPPSGS